MGGAAKAQKAKDFCCCCYLEMEFQVLWHQSVLLFVSEMLVSTCAFIYRVLNLHGAVARLLSSRSEFLPPGPASKRTFFLTLMLMLFCSQKTLPLVGFMRPFPLLLSVKVTFKICKFP